jgi:hypothetical protein
MSAPRSRTVIVDDVPSRPFSFNLRLSLRAFCPQRNICYLTTWLTLSMSSRYTVSSSTLVHDCFLDLFALTVGTRRPLTIRF